jgi:hypothetical protein
MRAVLLQCSVLAALALSVDVSAEANDSNASRRAAAVAAFNEIAKASPPHLSNGSAVKVFVEVIGPTLVIHKSDHEVRVLLTALRPTVNSGFHDASDPATVVLTCASFPKPCASEKGGPDDGLKISTIYVDFDDKALPGERALALWREIVGGRTVGKSPR